MAGMANIAVLHMIHQLSNLIGRLIEQPPNWAFLDKPDICWGKATHLSV